MIFLWVGRVSVERCRHQGYPAPPLVVSRSLQHRGAVANPPGVSHHIETVLREVLGVVCFPVGQTLDQGLVVCSVVKLDQPLGGGAMLSLKEGEQGSDGTLASGGGHRGGSFD